MAIVVELSLLVGVTDVGVPVNVGDASGALAANEVVVFAGRFAVELSWAVVAVTPASLAISAVVKPEVTAPDKVLRSPVVPVYPLRMFSSVAVEATLTFASPLTPEKVVFSTSLISLM